MAEKTASDTSAHSSSESATQTISVAIAADTDFLVVKTIAFNDVSPENSKVSGVTFNSVALTNAIKGYFTDNSSFDISTEIWYLIAPDITTANVVVTYQGSNTNRSVIVEQYKNVKQVSPVDNTNKAEVHSAQTTTSLSLTTSKDNALLVDALFFSDNPGTINPISPGVASTSPGVTRRASHAIAAVAGSNSIGWTHSVSTGSLHVAVAFLPIELEEGGKIKIKLAGTFVEKPLKTKIAGTFTEKPILVKSGGNF